MVANNISEFGVEGEKDICNLLRTIGYPVRRTDGHILINGQYCMIEQKHKSRVYDPPPFYGHGLDKKQWDHYLDFQAKTGMRIILFIRCNGQIIWNYVDELERGPKHETKNKIIVFPIERFRPWKELIFR